MKTRITSIISGSALAAAMVLAHGGLQHVMGTVTLVGGASVTVRTTAGKTVQVAVDAKTTYSRASKAVQKSDVKVGDRVVIHAEQHDKALLGKTVELGPAPAAKASPTKAGSGQQR
ncbi:MAG TPA: hypothetical protein VKV74_01040 [Bryobacteraceae bacterium]|nr:hypothetical protein [Bryobacteraceae bacterium]